MSNIPARTKWRLGIQGKFALVAILLILGAGGYALYWHLFPATSRIVVEHELVDLADEAELRCWEMLDSVNQLRSLVDRCAKNPEYYEKLERHLNRSSAGNAGGAGANDSGLPRWYDTILAVRLVEKTGAVAGGVRQYPEDPALHFTDPELPPVPESLLRLVLEQDGAAVPRLSEVLRAELPEGYTSVRSTRRLPDAGAPLLTIPVLWGLCRSSADRSKAVAILLPLERSRSPRHLSFLLDRGGEFLQHPAIRKAAAAQVEIPFPELDIQQEILKLDRNRGWIGEDSTLQVQRGGPPFQKYLVTAPFYYLEGEAGEALRASIASREDKRRADWSERQRLLHEKVGVRFGGAGRGSPVVRLLARSQPDLDAARARLDAAYADEYKIGPQPVRWHTMMQLAQADVQLVRFDLRLTDDERGRAATSPYYYFAYVAFREELAASVNYEFRGVKRTGLLLCLAAGGIAFLVTIFFVRPLRKITRAAQSVTEGNGSGDASRLQHQVEAVRQSLPVGRRDEVGDIARSLESLLRQVNNGHERLRQLNADLEDRVQSRTAELSEANTELRGLAAAKDAFLASVSHELRQPLNSIFGYLQFLESSALNAEQTGDVGKVRMAAMYLRRLIDDILDYQKIIMGGIELDPEPLDGTEFFSTLRDSMIPQAQERGNTLVFSGIGVLGVILHDRARLQQIFINLLSNACKFTQQGKVTLTAFRETSAAGRDWLVVQVADDGRGMTAEEQKLLFTKFKKLAAREGNKTGTGLGLVICKGLCELMGGSIVCESEFGCGTTFTVRLPADLTAVGPAPEQAPATTVLVVPALDLPAGRSASVLVIDDDPGVRELMRRYLEGKGYRVLTAKDGEEGLAIASREQPSVITLDVVLPGRDGWEILAALKSSPDTLTIPVLMVTFIEDSAHGYALGAADYLVKPVVWDDLSARLARLIGAEDAAAPILIVDDDAPTRELFRRALEHDGRRVMEAADGAEALRILATDRPGLILLDLMMPVMDGFEFVEACRSRPEWHGIPIVIVTAKHPTNEDRARLSGCVRAILEKGGSTSGNLMADILGLIHHHVPPLTNSLH